MLVSQVRVIEDAQSVLLPAAVCKTHSCGLWTVLMLPPLPSCRALVLSLSLDGKAYTIAIFKRSKPAHM